MISRAGPFALAFARAVPRRSRCDRKRRAAECGGGIAAVCGRLLAVDAAISADRSHRQPSRPACEASAAQAYVRAPDFAPLARRRMGRAATHFGRRGANCSSGAPPINTMTEPPKTFTGPPRVSNAPHGAYGPSAHGYASTSAPAQRSSTYTAPTFLRGIIELQEAPLIGK